MSMNKVNKYRAWDKEDKRMITHEQEYIPLKVCSLGVLRLHPGHEENLYSIMDIDRFEMMQCIGLKDKNRKDIYEGDIVKGYSKHLGEWQQKLVVREGLAWNVIPRIGFQLNILHTDIQVIGNIYETPELNPQKDLEQE